MQSEEHIPSHDGKRASSPSPTYVSMRSDQSMGTPILFKEGGRPPEQRLSSPSPTYVSMRSDQSMGTPILFKEGGRPPEQRSVSPAPSYVSIRGDRSMGVPIQFSWEDPPNRGTPEKSSSPSLTFESMRSDRSMGVPIQFRDGDGSLEPSKVHYGVPSPPMSYMPSRGEPSPSNSKRLEEIQTILASPQAEINRMLKSNLGVKFQRVFEVTSQQGNATLLKEIYTDLFITEGGNGHITDEHETRFIERALKTVSEEDMPINCNDIFNSSRRQSKTTRLVLTRGVAGIGKTVSVQKFIMDWAEGKANQDVHFLFPISFSELNMIKTQMLSLMDVLRFFYTESKEINPSEMEKSVVVFILDGLDECRYPLDFQNNKILSDITQAGSLDVLLTNLIKGNLLPSALLWITSRPAAAGQIPPKYVDRMTEIRGFDDQQKEEYFRKKIRDPNLTKKIISHIKSSRSLYIMCQIPVFCFISATVLERTIHDAKGGNIPKNLTEMYTHFLIIQTKIIEERYTDRHTSLKDIIFRLGKLAFEHLERGNLIFYKEDLRECGIDMREAAMYSGICTQIFRAESWLREGQVYCFVHLSIQEHLAALYVFLSFSNNNTNVLHKPHTKADTLSGLQKTAVDKALRSVNGHLDLFLRFLLGLSQESNQALLGSLHTKMVGSSQDRGETIKYIKEKVKATLCPNESVALFHCLNELNDNSLVEEIQKFLNSGAAARQSNLSNELWHALVFVLLTSDEPLDEFVLHKYGKSDLVALLMMPVIAASRKAQLSDCNLSWKCCAILGTALTRESNMRALDLSHNDLQDKGVELLCTDAKKTGYTLERIWSSLGIPCFGENGQKRQFNKVKLSSALEDPECQLNTLRLRNCGVTAEGCDSLSLALRSNPSHLRTLDLSSNNVGDAGVTLLCAALEEEHCNLETLMLKQCNLRQEGCAALASALGSTRLKELTLNKNQLCDAGVRLLSTGLSDPHCTLERLRLSDCSITAQGCAALASALRSNPSHLIELDLGRNPIRDSGVELITVFMADEGCKLEIIRLNHCGLSEESCTVLASVLHSTSSSLRELDLSANDIKDSGAKQISAGLKTLYELETLRMYTCGITEEGCVSLASALRSNPSQLKELDLRGNTPGERGAELLSLLQGPENKEMTLYLSSSMVTKR